MTDKIQATKTEILEHWTLVDLVHAHALLDESERAEFRQQQKHRRGR